MSRLLAGWTSRREAGRQKELTYVCPDEAWRDSQSYSVIRALIVLFSLIALFIAVTRVGANLIRTVGLPTPTSEASLIPALYSQVILLFMILVAVAALRVFANVPVGLRWIGLWNSWVGTHRFARALRPRAELLATRLFYGVALGAVALLIYMGVVPIYRAVFGEIGYTGQESPEVLQTLPYQWWVLQVFLAVIAAPLLEETLFRGMIYGLIRRVAAQRAGRVLATSVAAVLCAIPFSLLHGFPSALATGTLVGGIIFALSYEITGSLWLPIAAHATVNAAISLASIAVLLYS